MGDGETYQDRNKSRTDVRKDFPGSEGQTCPETPQKVGRLCLGDDPGRAGRSEGTGRWALKTGLPITARRVRGARTLLAWCPQHQEHNMPWTLT